MWVLLAQAVSRLSAVWVFAVVARNVGAEDLGVLAVATALTASGVVLAPAIVGQPLAVLATTDQRRDLARQAQSFAVLASLGVGGALALGGLLSSGALAEVLLAAALGVPGAMAVESHYWRAVFVRGRRRAALVLSSAYVVQAAAVTAALALSDRALVLSPFLALAVSGTVIVVTDRLSIAAAWSWVGMNHSKWVPYVVGVAASAALVQAVPAIFAFTAGLSAASTYRAGELLFGGTNLLIGVVVQTQLTRASTDVSRTYHRACGLLVVVALLNGLLLALVPLPVLEVLVGPVTEPLREALGAFTALRVSFAAASVGAVLMLRRLTARRAGALGVVATAVSCACLVTGATAGGLVGGVAGLALAELLIATYYGRQLRRHTGEQKA